MKRSKMERLVSERNARHTEDLIKGSSEIYKNRFKNGGRKARLSTNVNDIDDELLEIADEAFSD